MTHTTIPHRDNLRNAIKWLSAQQLLQNGGREINRRSAIEKACYKFDLTPLEEAFLARHFSIAVDEEDR